MNKIIVFALASFVCVNAHSQDLDSLKNKILKMDVAINNIHLNMKKSHKEFTTGSIILLAGIVMSGVYIVGREQGAGYEKPTLLYFGAGLSLVGASLQIDSHKYIGRGAKRE